MVDYAAAKRMMKYLNGTRDVALELRPRKGPLHLDGALVSSLWQTQVLIAWSSPEAEYYACTVEVSEAKFVQSLLLEWGEPGEIEHVVDNSSAITLGRWIGLGGVRHMETRYMWIQEELMAQRLKLTKINGTENATEVATKTCRCQQPCRSARQPLDWSTAQGFKGWYSWLEPMLSTDVSRPDFSGDSSGRCCAIG